MRGVHAEGREGVAAPGPVELALVAAVALAVRLPLVLSPQPLGFDDGVYGASVLAMRDGNLPFIDVFSSQGPAFLPLLRLGDLLALQADWGPRLAGLLAGALLAATGAWIVGRVAGRVPGLAAGALLATSGQLVLTSAAIGADLPVVAAGAVALALALAGRGPIAIGLAAGVAFSTKNLMSLPPLAAAFGVLWVKGGARQGALAVVRGGAVALAAAVALALPWGLGRVWEQSIAFHLDARPPGSAVGNLRTLRAGWRDDVLLAAAAVAVVGLAVSGDRRRAAAALRPDTGLAVAAVGLWTATSFLLLLLHRPLFNQHPTAFVAPLCLLVALARPWWPALAVAVVLLPAQLGDIGWRWPRSHPSGLTAEAIDDLRTLVPDGALVVADEPGLVWWAGRRTPVAMVDTSATRIRAGRLSAAEVADAAADPATCAVLSISGRFALLGPIELPGYVLARDYGEGRTLFLRRTCRQ